MDYRHDKGGQSAIQPLGGGMNDPSPSNSISKTQLVVLSAATGATVANAYYVHPFISDVATSFSLSEAQIGSVPSLNQMALALGILILLPLGDRINNKLLATSCAIAQTLCILVMAFAADFTLFLSASTILGFFTIAPYLLPAYVSKHVAPNRQGEATATLTVGVIASILLARAGGGVIAEYFGWRIVYWIALGIMLAASIALPFIMPVEASTKNETRQSYWALQASLPRLIARHRDVLLSGIIQGVNFGGFIALWLGIGLHLPSPEVGYGTDTVGYLTFLALINIFTTSHLGRWADKIGARKARFIVSTTRVLGAALLFLFDGSVWWLVPPLLVMGIFGPLLDVTGRMTIFEKAAEERTRLMTVYIVLMFIGAGLASWIGTLVYEYAEWFGVAGFCLALAVLALVLSAVSYKFDRPEITSQSSAA